MSELLWPDRSIGIFETLLVVEGTPIDVDAHLQRLNASVRELYGADAPGGARRLILDCAASVELGRLRLTVAPKPGGALDAKAVAVKVDQRNIFPSWELAVSLRPFVVQGGLGAHKWADREGIAWTEATQPDGGLPLVLDVNEEVLEASRANVFVVEGELLMTPRTDGRILPGVARACAIDTARSLGLEVREQALTVEQLVGAGEAFLTGSVRGIEPVRSLDEARLRQPGAAVSAVAAEMKRRWLGQEDRAGPSV